MLKWIIAALVLAAPARADVSANDSQNVTFLGSYTWQSDMPGFGGMSGIEVFDSGQSFYALNDRGLLLQGHFTRDQGIVKDITASSMLLSSKMPDLGLRLQIDSEGIALRPDGRVFISFEGEHRVWTYSDANDIGTWLPQHAEFQNMQHNSSLEALALDSSGDIYTIPERSGRETRPFPVYRYHGGTWTIPFHLPRRGKFLVTGADFDPDGRLYILERDFVGFGFRSRVRRFDENGQNEETLFETWVGTYDNLEGISVWQDSDGQLKMTLISDDNFRAFQRTQIVEYQINS